MKSKEKVFCEDCLFFKSGWGERCSHPDYVQTKDTPTTRFIIKHGDPLKLNKNNNCKGYIWNGPF